MRALSGTEGGDFPFWSPDSQSLAFFADRKLKRIGIAGGSPVTLCEVDPPGPAGGAWNQKGAVLFAGDDGVYQVSASGGVPARITQADAARHETAHGFPQFLPDGQRFLYFVQSPDVDVQGIYGAALDRPRGGSRILSTDHKALYSPPRGDHPGLLLWLRERALLAQPFDAGKLKLEGESTRLAENIAATTTATHSMAPSRAAFWLSNAGVLVYHTGAAAKRKLLWIGRDGKQIQEAAPEDEYTSLRLSPDSKRALVGRRDASDGKIDLWLLDLGRAVMTRLTVDGRETGFAVWSPDGRSVAYSSERRGVVQIYRKDAASGGLEEQLTDGPEPNYVTSWSHDGHYLFSTRVRGNTNDIWALPVKGVGPAGQKPFLAARIDSYAGSAAFSPDGKWMAYHSAESGRTEIYARPFTEAASGKTGKWQVSSQGGMSPKWRADGRELFYSTSGGIAAAAVRTGSGNFESDAPHDLFRGPGGREYDPSADGERFLVLAPIAAGPASASPLTVVVNWQVWLNK
jgi:Tol biopolymer transport system component